MSRGAKNQFALVMKSPYIEPKKPAELKTQIYVPLLAGNECFYQYANDDYCRDGIFTIDLDGKLDQWLKIDIQACDIINGETIPIKGGELHLLMNPSLSQASWGANFTIKADENLSEGESGFVPQYFDKDADPNATYDLQLHGLYRSKGEYYYKKFNPTIRRYESGTAETAEYAIDGTKGENPRIEVHPQFAVDSDVFDEKSETIHPHRKLLMSYKHNKEWDYFYKTFCALKRRPNILKKTDSSTS